MTVPLPGPLHTHRDRLRRAGRPRLHRHLVGRGRRRRRLHAAGPGRGVGAAAAPRHGDRARLHPGAGVPGPVRGVAGRRRAGPVRASASARRSNVIVERWNGVPFVEPYKKVRDVVRFLRDALERREGRQGVRHVRDPGLPARRPSRAAAADPRRRAARGHAAPRRPRGRRRDHQLAVGRRRARRWPASSTTPPAARTRRSWPASSCARARTPRSCGPAARFAIAAYLNVPVYAAFHELAGPRRALQPMWDAWKAGDRKAALAAIPDEVVDELSSTARRQQCRAHDPALLRQRRDDELAGDHAARSGRGLLGRRPRSSPRART